MEEPSKIAEQRESVSRLMAAGLTPLVAALQDNACYYRGGSGRLVLAKLARILNVTPDEARSMLHTARRIVM